MLHAAVTQVEAGIDLSMNEMADAMNAIMDGRCDETEIERLLVALHRKGETFTEIAGAAQAMRRHMTVVRTRHPFVLDVVGTGGDCSGTFNISTAAAFVTAAAGAPVAKHGSRRYTSRSGAADVLSELGVNVEADPSRVEACLDELGICFCFAPFMHRAMRYVVAVRQRIPTPTIFNILGPLANPAKAPFQLLGVGKPHLRAVIADALRLLDSRRAVVVHGADGLDEVTLGGVTHVTEVAAGGQREFTWTPDDFDLPPAELATLQAESPAASAAIIRGILAGQGGPPRDIVVANAAAALWTAELVETPRAGARRAAEAIDSGAAAELLARLAERTTAQS